MAVEDARDDRSLIGPHGHDFSELRRELTKFDGERILFVPNYGNGGDALINLGATQFLDRIGVRYERGTSRSDCRGRVVFYSGGGNLVQPYPNLKRFIERNESQCAAFVILPHTVRAYSSTLAAMGQHSTIFAREQASFDFLNKHLGGARALLSHDMAFMLDQNGLRGMRRPIPESFTRRRLRRRLVRALRSARMAVERARYGSGTLNAFRTDVEAPSGRPRPPGNNDLSRLFAVDDMSEWSCATTARHLAKAIAPYEKVRTDRLHIAILSALIGKRVHMLDNSYGKNRDIFEHSIRDYFDNVEFGEPADHR